MMTRQVFYRCGKPRRSTFPDPHGGPPPSNPDSPGLRIGSDPWLGYVCVCTRQEPRGTDARFFTTLLFSTANNSSGCDGVPVGGLQGTPASAPSSHSALRPAGSFIVPLWNGRAPKPCCWKWGLSMLRPRPQLAGRRFLADHLPPRPEAGNSQQHCSFLHPCLPPR